MSDNIGGGEILRFVIRLAASAAFAIFLLKKLQQYMDPTREDKKSAKLLAERILKDLGVENVKELTEYEMSIASHLISNDTGVSWSDIGGYDSEISDLRDNVMLPLKYSSDSKLFVPPKGVLLYGPPGCGKTLIAKALAKSAGARFVNLQVSSLTDKWYGESNKLTAAVFTLAKKIQPTIIFIDEIDSFLRSRDRHDHEATAMMKALFLSLWDGFASDHRNLVILLGATNRPQDVDPAILRRMPLRHYIGLPDKAQRQQILSVILQGEQTDADLDLCSLASSTKGFSGSDLREVARQACMYCAKENVLDDKESNHASFINMLEMRRPLRLDDFKKAVLKYNRCKDISDLHSFTSAAD